MRVLNVEWHYGIEGSGKSCHSHSFMSNHVVFDDRIPDWPELYDRFAHSGVKVICTSNFPPPMIPENLVGKIVVTVHHWPRRMSDPEWTWGSGLAREDLGIELVRMMEVLRKSGVPQHEL